MGKKRKFDGLDVCIAMHTALRKVCDSDLTSALYNLIHLRSELPESKLPGEFDAWRVFGGLVAEKLETSRRDLAVKAAIVGLEDRFYSLVDDGSGFEKKAPCARTMLFALLPLLRSLPTEDVAGMAEFL